MTISRRTALGLFAAAPFLAGPALARPTMMGIALNADLRRHLAELPSILNGPADATAWDGKAVVVNFFASWCPPCHPEAQILTDLAAEWSDDPVRFVAINAFEDFGGAPNPDRLNRFLDRHQPPFPVVEEAAETRTLFGGVDRIPTLFVFAPDGRAVYVFVHERGSDVTHSDRASIEKAVAKALTA